MTGQVPQQANLYSWTLENAEPDAYDKSIRFNVHIQSKLL